MRFSLFGLCLVVCSIAAAGEQSVVVKEQPTEAKASAVVVGECAKCRLYNVEETCDESCRNRLFGGYVKKQTVRKVYRPVRR